MQSLIQRVSEASVSVDGQRIAQIGRGLLVLVAVVKTDTEKSTSRMAERLLSFRVFPGPDEAPTISAQTVGDGNTPPNNSGNTPPNNSGNTPTNDSGNTPANEHSRPTQPSGVNGPQPDHAGVQSLADTRDGSRQSLASAKPRPSGRLEQNIVDVGGSVLLVPQFTLGADVRKGTRASFHPLAEPQRGRELFEQLCESLDKSVQTAQGVFGAHMQVALVNDGPVTFALQT